MRRKSENWQVLIQHCHLPLATFIRIKFAVIHFSLRRYGHLGMNWLSFLFQLCTANQRLDLRQFLLHYGFGQNDSTCSKVMMKVWNPRYPPENLLDLSVSLPPKTGSNFLKRLHLSRHRYIRMLLPKPYFLYEQIFIDLLSNIVLFSFCWPE